jgi:hypothetical protein
VRERLSLLLLAWALAAPLGCGRPEAQIVDDPVTVPAELFSFPFSGLVPPSVSVPATPATVATPTTVGSFSLRPNGNRSALLVAGGVVVSAEFLITNHGLRPVERLALIAYAHPSFRAGSALAGVRLASGQPASDTLVHAIHPSHALALQGDVHGRHLLGLPEGSDFLALREGELPPALAAATPLPYGFWVADGGAIEPGGVGRVTIAFTFPIGTRAPASLASFVWHAAPVELPALRSTQAALERHPPGWAATIARAGAPHGRQVAALGAGVRDLPDGFDCGRLLSIANVRIAGRAGDADAAWLLPAALAQLPTFPACPGASP